MCDEFLMGCTLLTDLYTYACCFLAYRPTCTFSGYINRFCRHTVESYCVSWIYCPTIC